MPERSEHEVPADPHPRLQAQPRPVRRPRGLLPAKAAEVAAKRLVRQHRRLRFRGRPAHGLHWEGEIGVGRRIAAGTGPWSSDSVYVVTEETVMADDRVDNIAVPAPWSRWITPGAGRQHG
jgi:hypothetical protein